MSISLLVVTPHASFGELIRQSLEETGSYRVRVVRDVRDVIAYARTERAALAFLDLDMGELLISQAGQALREANPRISLVVIASEDTPPALDALRPWVLLRKPFYLPDLLTTLGEAFSQSPRPRPEQAPASPAAVPAPTIPSASASTPTVRSAASMLADLPDWLRDADLAARHLTRLTLESAAQAALLTRAGQLWAYAGQLSQPAAAELVSAVMRQWDPHSGGDLLRFVRLEATSAQHMLYATPLSDDLVLALVFDAETSFSTIRGQAARLVGSLQPAPPPVATPAAVPPASSAPEPEAPAAIEEEDDGQSVPDIGAILSDIPAPDAQPEIEVPTLRVEAPEVNRTADPDVAATRPSAALPPDLARTRPSTPAPRAPGFSLETSPAMRLPTVLPTETPGAPEGDLDVTLPSKSRRRQAEPVGVSATRASITDVARRVTLEPPPGLYNLTYACLLVPRMGTHFLTGTLADSLSAWMPQICVAYGWRLEYLAVRPDYLQWVVSVQPSTSPGYLMRIVRQQTSERIFAEFTRIKQENPSGDFWAPGYLIMGGSQPHPPQLVRDYIRTTRQQQGLAPRE